MARYRFLLLPLLVAALVLLLLQSAPTATAEHFLFHFCEGSNYTANSSFHSNLRTLLASLSSSDSSFSTDIKGDDSNKTYGLVMCRGDVGSNDCKDCIKAASNNITQLCPQSMKAIVWYDYCQLRYSDSLFFTSSANDGRIGLMVNTGTQQDPGTFMAKAKELMGKVADHAVRNSSPLFFATGMIKYRSDLPAIYGLAQCTGDLSADACSQCLQGILTYFWNDSYAAQRGGRILGYSCNFRYEVYTFFAGDPTISLGTTISPPPIASNTSHPPTPTVESASQSGKGKKNTGAVLAIGISLAVALVLSFVFYICFHKRRSAKNTAGKSKMEEILNMESLLFDLSILKSATDNFADSNKLGQGGFGTVYKGILLDGQEIAVKRLSVTSRQGLEELKNELLLVAKLQHKNLVRLRGVCLEKEEKLLVYEYLPNRSLDTFLFDPVKCKQLNWPRRFEIIRGIARGLRYLHEESHLKVIHRDLKASNLLLDAELNPKIADFGMARLFGVDQTQKTTSRVVGTFGYMAPEYAMRGQFSVKADVFSFGVLVLEIVTGRKSNSFGDSGNEQDLLSYTWEHWSEDTGLEIVDPSLGERFSRNEVLRCIQVGLLCVQDVPANRPLMSSAILMLDSPTATLQAPVQPTFSAGISSGISSMDWTDRSATESKSIVSSVNDVTISELHPR
ncbi:putative receptor-like protein kinase [Iris pallida]|uniref:Receptor-like protein kinase n=1 Tax=Iris pallida TaxID=29817 RepID=A0AAX6I7F7_IRIPA|nr:putative receptor-like protein kinase [Iris pallida]